MQVPRARTRSAIVAILALVAGLLAISAGSALATEHCDATVTSPGTSATIQAAINAAAPGDTVCLEAGTYAVTSTINITKPLTLSGPNHDNDPTAGGVRDDEAILEGATSRGVRVRASDVTIEGLSFTGFSSTATWHNGADAVDGVAVSHNVFDGNASAFATSQAAAGNPNLLENLSIVSNLITNNASRGISSYTGVHGEGFVISGNEFVDAIVSIHLGFVDGVSITDNSFTVVEDWYAVLLASDIANVDISSNVFDGNDVADVALWTWPATNVLGAVTVTDNHIVGFAFGIDIPFEDVDVSAWAVNDNRIEGNDVGVNNDGSGTLDATCNWWGAANGPSGAGDGDGDAVTGDVEFLPWHTAPEGPCEGGLNPTTKDDCKDGGYEEYGFRNQGQCITFVATGNDSR